ncbi:Uu.00g110440.m01.CDS01 [Anthostomella pinea]|uniref:Uu.00g110440.m01.CDS01 n=1 Tax=Anthostomella pinea TaxID=933095 RepID=A0AAI8VFE5_9PEZI|nr:Uu.00g110440.m01.CDS01 [Anthostomella pinea]
MVLLLSLAMTLLGAFAALVYGPVKHTCEVMGLFRPHGDAWVNIHGIENRVIPDTVACEDLHYHEASGMLYSACSGDIEEMAGWFPGATALDHPEKASHGTLVVIDPKTMRSQKLTLSNFKGPFVAHGISVFSSASDPKTVYVFAINHLPNPLWKAGSSTQPKAASQIEVFTHTVGSRTAKHLRSISHPKIRTPNDVLALSEHEFLVTNDHYYREGPMRLVEELIRDLRAWTDLVHVRFDDEGNVNATVSLDSIPTNNGLGWGPDRQQVLISDAIGGRIYFAGLPDPANRTVVVSHHVKTGSVVDNPKYFSDPYAGLDGKGKDYSGYLLPGIGRGLDFVNNYGDATGKAPLSSHVAYLPAVAGKDKARSLENPARLIFSDDGTAMRGATTGVLVAIDPAVNDGKREGWLFVTGVVAPHMLATRIDFETVLG